jgi:hypothetical protein
MKAYAGEPRRKDQAMGTRTLVAVTKLGIACCVALLSLLATVDAAAQSLYWTGFHIDGSGSVNRLDLATGLSTVLVVDGRPMSIVVDEQRGKMYWHENNRFWLIRANLDGTGFEVVFEGNPLQGGFPQHVIDSSAGKIYWRDQMLLPTLIHRECLTLFRQALQADS